MAKKPVIVGTNGSDVITDPPNNVVVQTGGGADTVVLGLFTEQALGITVNGGAGADLILDFNVGGPQTLHNTLLGGNGNDTIVTGSFGDKIDGGAGADQIYAGAGNHLYLDGSDTVHLVASYNGRNIPNFPNLNSGTTDLHGCVANTKFDFSSVTPPRAFYNFEHVPPVGTDPSSMAQEPFKLCRSNFSFNNAGDLVVEATATNGMGTYHNTMTGTPFHDAASFDAAIAHGTVIF